MRDSWSSSSRAKLIMAVTAGGMVRRRGIEFCQYKPDLKAVALMEIVQYQWWGSSEWGSRWRKRWQRDSERGIRRIREVIFWIESKHL